MKKIPLAKNSHWLTKNLKEFAIHPISFLQKQQAEYGNIVELDMCVAKTYLLSKPEYVKYVLQDNNKNYQKSLAYEIALKLLLGNGLVTSEGDFWRKQRRMAQPAFHKKRLEGFIDIMVESTNQLLAKFEHYATTNETFDAQVEMTAVTAEIVARALFSSDVTGLVEKVNESISELNEFAVDRLQSIVRVPTWIPTPRNRKLNHHLDFIKNMIGDIIDKRKVTNETKDDLLSMLIEAKDEENGRNYEPSATY